MRVGIGVTNFDFPGGAEAIGPRVAGISRAADEAGLDSLWAMDHFWQIAGNGAAEDPMLEVYAVLSFMAAVTSRVRLGAHVTGVVYRHPGVLLQQVTSLDVLSGGRAYLGIGAGWFEEEAVAHGVPFPSLRERFELLERTLEMAKGMWERDEPMCHPQPLSRPHPPILVGGGGEKKTLRLVARWADACDIGEGPELEHKLGVLRGWCEKEGRAYDDIEKCSGGHVRDLDRDELLRRGEALRALGVDHWILEPHRRPWDDETLDFVCGIAGEVQAL